MQQLDGVLLRERLAGSCCFGLYRGGGVLQDALLNKRDYGIAAAWWSLKPVAMRKACSLTAAPHPHAVHVPAKQEIAAIVRTWAVG